MWTKFYSLEFSGMSDSESPPSHIKIWIELGKYLKNSDFTCIKRGDGSVLVDAKTERNAQSLEKLDKLCDIKVTTTRDPKMNSTRGTVLIPRT